MHEVIDFLIKLIYNVALAAICFGLAYYIFPLRNQWRSETEGIAYVIAWCLSVAWVMLGLVRLMFLFI